MGNLDAERYTQTEDNVKKEREKTAIHKAMKEGWNRLFLLALSRNQPCLHLDFGLSLQSCETCVFVVLSHVVCGTLLRQPQQTNTVVM